MIVDKIRSMYEAKREIQRGHPTGSKFGSCTAQLQFLLYPDVSKPEPYPPRALMVMEEGKMIEQWWRKRLDEVYAQRRGAWVGLRDEPFYLPVSLSSDEAEAAQRKIEGRILWGTVLSDTFDPPRVWADAGAIRTRLLACKKCGDRKRDHGWPCGKRIGLVLDSSATLWCPTYIDRAVLDPDHGLFVVEEKALSSFGFMRMVSGQPDYGHRCQLAGEGEATGANVLWLAYRKDTAHLAEIVYSRRVERTRVAITKSTGLTEVFFVAHGQMVSDGGKPTILPDQVAWDAAEVWTPFEPDLLDQIRARIRRVVTAQPVGPWHREYGPDFRCAVCRGTGTRTFRKGTATPLKTPKLCEECEGGVVSEAPLPRFPCGYCSVVAHCYEPAKVRLEVADKPTYWVGREDFENSGIALAPPEPTPTPRSAVEVAP